MTVHNSDFDVQTVGNFPLSELKLDALNARRDYPDGEIEALAASIQTNGLLQNLCGIQREDGAIGIVAGGRRLAAIRLLAERGEYSGTIPVLLAASEDQASFWTNVENTAREDLTPAQEVIAYRDLRKSGKSSAEIALAFAVTQRHVDLRLKLAGLDDVVISALSDRLITIDVAGAFTMSPSKDRTVEVLDAVSGRGVNASRVLAMLKEDAIDIAADRRALFVGREEFRAAGGTETTDLFSEKVFFDDADLLETLFEKKCAALKEAYVEQGWLWAEIYGDSYFSSWNLPKGLVGTALTPIPGVLSAKEEEEFEALEVRDSTCDWEDDYDPLTDDESARYNALTEMLKGNFSDQQRSISGGYIVIDGRGNVGFHGGYIRKEDEAAAIEAGVITPDTKVGGSNVEKPKAAMSGALTEDLDRIRLGAIQVAGLRDPHSLTTLLAYALSGARGYGGSFLDIRPGTPSISPVTEGSYEEPAGLKMMDEMSFEDFSNLSQDAQKQALLVGISRMLGGSYNNKKDRDQLADLLGADIREVWTPTAEGFWKRVSAGFMIDVLTTILETDAADPRIKKFAALKKTAKADYMEQVFQVGCSVRAELDITDAQIKAISVWRPAGY